jgi:hypothetical protein
VFGLEYASREIRAALRHLDGPCFVARTRRFPWLSPRLGAPGSRPFSKIACTAARLGVDMNKRLAIEQEAVTA